MADGTGPRHGGNVGRGHPPSAAICGMRAGVPQIRGTMSRVDESNAALARRGWEAALRGDLAAVAGMLDPDVKWHGGGPSDGAACHNREEALRFMRLARTRQPLPTLVTLRASGDKVVLILERPGCEGQVATRVANLTTFRDGKVVEMVHYEDPADALAAAGLSTTDLPPSELLARPPADRSTDRR